MNTRILLDGWLDGAVRSYGYMAGAQTLKNFLRTAAEVMMGHLQEEAQSQGSAITGQDARSVLESLGRAEVALGVMSDGHLNVSGTDNELEVMFVGCPYASVCSGILSDLVQSDIPRSNLPCLRGEVCGAAITVETGDKVRYSLKQFAPGDRCVVALEIM